MDVLAPAVERLLLNHLAGLFPGIPLGGGPKNITIL
jgi:hypothetical protein